MSSQTNLSLLTTPTSKSFSHLSVPTPPLSPLNPSLSSSSVEENDLGTKLLQNRPRYRKISEIYPLEDPYNNLTPESSISNISFSSANDEISSLNPDSSSILTSTLNTETKTAAALKSYKIYLSLIKNKSNFNTFSKAISSLNQSMESELTPIEKFLVNNVTKIFETKDFPENHKIQEVIKLKSNPYKLKLIDTTNKKILRSPSKSNNEKERRIKKKLFCEAPTKDSLLKLCKPCSVHLVRVHTLTAIVPRKSNKIFRRSSRLVKKLY